MAAVTAATVVHQDDVAFIRFGIGENTFDNRVCRRRRAAVHFSPVVRIDSRADYYVAHILRYWQVLDLARRFGLVVDAVWRTEKRRFHAEAAFQQQFREV